MSVESVDEALEQSIMYLLAIRGGATICPSEAARRVSPQDWRDLMDRTRAAAHRLHRAGRIHVTQRGELVDPEHARGPIRLRLPDAPVTAPARRTGSLPSAGAHRRA